MIPLRRYKENNCIKRLEEEQYLLNHAVQQTEDLYQLILGSVTDIILITDDTGAFTFISQNVKALLGYSDREMQKLENIAQLLGDDCFDCQDLDVAKELHNLERQIIDSAGQAHTILINVKRVAICGGTILYSCRDITGHKQAKEKLQQLHQELSDLEHQVETRTAQLQLAYEFEATLKRIADNVRESLDETQIMQTVVKELATTLKVNVCNAALYNLEQGTSSVCYEYTTIPCSYLGRSLQLADFQDVYSQLLQGQAFQFCSLIPNSDRGRVALLACPIMDDHAVLGDLWLTHLSEHLFTERDIHLIQQVASQCAIALRQSRLYQAAQTQVSELERLNRLKDDFLSTVSHELRTPMASIKMATQMLEIILKHKGVLSTEPSQVSRYLQILHTECQRETNLINDLLDLSRFEAGTESLVITKIDLTIWIPNIAEPFVERAHVHRQQLLVDFPPQLPAVTTDLSVLERILTELLANACKYTPAGETITVTAELVAQTLKLSVANTGVEIPAHERDRIFERFYRIPNSDPWKYGGTGLGLALVKKLVEHLRGTIQVESFNNQTHFIVKLPAQLGVK